MRKENKIFISILVFIQILTLLCWDMQAWYGRQVYSTANRHTLSPDTSLDNLAAKKYLLGEGYRKFKARNGNEDLNGWLPLGLVGAFFRDYVPSLPSEKHESYRAHYRNF